MAVGTVTGPDRPFFVVTSTGENCDPIPCLESVASQEYPFKRHNYIAADPETARRAASWDGRPRAVVSLSRLTVLENVFTCWQTLRDSDVIVWLDGDDWLLPGALEKLAKVYAEKDPWLTYGSFRFHPPHPAFGGTSLGSNFGTRYPEGSDPRRDVWRATHLKTFRAGLVKRVREASLHMYGSAHLPFLGYCTDRALMFPMLEMAGERYEAIAEELSVYNFGESFSATNRDPAKTAEEEHVRDMIQEMLPRYSRLEERPW